MKMPKGIIDDAIIDKVASACSNKGSVATYTLGMGLPIVGR
jgi:hypothetical protein